MSQRLVILLFAAMLLLFGVLIAACSSDSDDAGNGGAGSETTEPADDGDGDSDATEPADGGAGDSDATEPADDGDGDGGSSGSGSATLTVGDESWSFDVTACAFPNEESGSGQISFRMSGVGETDDGVAVQLQATIQDIQGEGRYEGDGVIHIVQMNDMKDAGDSFSEAVALGWISSVEIFDGLERVIKVDGKNVVADTTFDDMLTTSDFEDVPGTLVAACP